MRRLRVFTLLAVVASSPAVAQVVSIESSTAGQRFGDPKRVVCEVFQTTGTRLGARKVCKTAEEWAQMKAEHRETLEKVQQQATSTGTPSG